MDDILLRKEGASRFFVNTGLIRGNYNYVEGNRAAQYWPALFQQSISSFQKDIAELMQHVVILLMNTLACFFAFNAVETLHQTFFLILA